MSGPVQRQPWFWALLTAVAALFIFTMVIVAANRSDDRPDSTTVVQQPSPNDQPEVVPVPVPTPSTPPSATVPSTPAPPAPPVVRERTIIIPDNEKAKPPAARTPEPVPTPDPSTSRITEVKEFRSTGLPIEIRFEDRAWRASEERTVTDPTTELKSIGTTNDDAEVWVPATAVEPYDQVFIAVLDEEGKYVVYRKR